MRDYTIDELARAAGTNVRNVRVYQDRGLLPPAGRRGRASVYGDAHLARLRLVMGMLERGYALAQIKEMLTAWEAGRDLGDLLGLEDVLSRPWSDEHPVHITADELRAALGGESPEAVAAAAARAVELGLLEPEGEGYNVPSPRLLQAGQELVRAGMPLPEVLELAAGLRRHADEIADLFVDVVCRTTVTPGNLTDEGGVAEFTDLVARLRPLALTAASAALAQSMSRKVPEAVADNLTRLVGRSRAH
ncbi:MerR family transcriptional regulator [Bailinhaonella thermotolerans]|uniref:MerR family transcriptional regulator n=1 Tax=Bailinhaonella thermotolerans TaxID=1070861 RepID=A0A3A4AFJ5_9ACTN|nr:MerR family transcriptional regulator [Bailinhaonella thermotolerans]RJL24780.1 MerR family transcriptional regulator [Bailinhaonella thermotolerans]